MTEWLGIPAAFIAWGFAVYVCFVAPATVSSRLLITMLLVDGSAVISSGSTWPYVDVLFGWDYPVWWRIHFASDWAVIFVYLAFIGATVNSPLARPFAGRFVRGALLLTGAILAAGTALIERETFDAVIPLVYTLIAVVLTWGFAAAVHAWITAPDRATRARARAFTFAFGYRDTIWMVTFLMSALIALGRIDDNSAFATYAQFFYVTAVIVYVPLVAYGMLRTQLFDVDLRIKRTLRRSTVVATFVAVFFLISGLAELFLSNLLGNLLGLLCTSALVFFLDPLQRAAERLSDAAMPKTQDTPEYEAFRKLQVYEAAMHASVQDGKIPSQQRPVLDALISSLGIDPATARRLEEDAAAHAAGPPAGH